MDLEKIVRELINYPREANWFEFKENWYEPNGLGEYISSLSNVAALEGQAFGYLIWGVIPCLTQMLSERQSLMHLFTTCGYLEMHQ